MDNSNDNFDSLRQLLQCKRYEQPPPGYFISFSDKVLARIEAEHEVQHSSWWTWFVNWFDAKPVLVGMYGLAVSSLLLLGFRLSQVFDAELSASPSLGGPWLAAAPGSPLFSSLDVSTISFSGGTTAANSAAPHSSWLSQDSSRLLMPLASLQVQPVSFLSH